MTERAGRPDQILGATVSLTGWLPGRDAEVAEVLELLLPGPVSLDASTLPLTVLPRASTEKAERARALLEEAGGTVSVEEVWATREETREVRARPACPSCGSARTQPFTHAGPAARVNMRCTDCGHTFRHRDVRE